MSEQGITVRDHNSVRVSGKMIACSSRIGVACWLGGGMGTIVLLLVLLPKGGAAVYLPVGLGVLSGNTNPPMSNADREVSKILSEYDAQDGSKGINSNIDAVLKSYPMEEVVRVLERAFLSDKQPRNRARVLDVLVRALTVHGAQGPAAALARSIAEKALFDQSREVAQKALLVLWYWKYDEKYQAELQRLVKTRIEVTGDPGLLLWLFAFLPTDGGTVLLAQLDKPIPKDPEEQALWRTKARAAMENCPVYPGQVPQRLGERIVDTVASWPQLGDAAARCLVRIRAVEMVSRLEIVRQACPEGAQVAIDAALAILDPSESRLRSIQDHLSKVLAEARTGSRPVADIVQHYDWACYVAAQLKQEPFILWLIKFAQAQGPKGRSVLLQCYVEGTRQVPYVVLLGLDACTEQELKEFFATCPVATERTNEVILNYGYTKTPSVLKDRLRKAELRLRECLAAAQTQPSGSRADTQLNGP